jgi:hypothetical protein
MAQFVAHILIQEGGAVSPHHRKPLSKYSRPLRSKDFCFCGLVLSYRVKQAAKRQAKQCTALFCATPRAIFFL